ncbi:DgyrCDS8127 [Dimorphilus gyrociliatus]|uniref:DgyrCDS8127 n=1 Tax=Dimorphilus gyrociliatus TaxID=2664684 RepID=A0A7I8VY86_9ANNE|nr:DgyrCDS8127 [Dimorphilus gyrociliatus]
MQGQRVIVNRDIETLQHLEESYPRIERKKKFQEIVDYTKKQCCCSRGKAIDKTLSFFPFIYLLRGYSLKSDLIMDIIAGLNIGTVHISQGLGFALLTSVPAIYGLYSSFYPLLIYFFFGSSKYVSMGTMALISIMLGSVVDRKIEDSDVFIRYQASNNSATLESELNCAKVQIAMGVTCVVGIVQVVLCLLRGGFITNFMSKPLIRGFTTAAAVHIITSQIKSFLGIEIKRHDGLFKIPMTYYEIFKNIKKTNLADFLIGSACFFVLMFIKQVITPRIKKRFKKCPPLPAELIVMAVCTGISYKINFNSKYSVSIIGDIPKGIPRPEAPSLRIMKDIIPDAVLIALISFIVSISVAKLFCEKSSSKVDANQELFSLGLIHIIGSFFFSFAGAAAPPRSMLNFSYGRSQISSLVSAVIVLLTMLWLSPLFASLTKSCLAAIVIVAILPLLLQFKDIYDWFELSMLDCFNWLIAFLTSVFLSLPYGLIIGISSSTLTVLLQHFMSSVSNLTIAIGPDILLDTKVNCIQKSCTSMRIIQVNSPILFINAEKILKEVKSVIYDMENYVTEMEKKYLIINSAGITNIDISGIGCLKSIRGICKDSKIELYFCCINQNILYAVENIMDFKQLLYPSLQDAISQCESYEKRYADDFNSSYL